MILVDTSVWIDFLRDVPGPATRWMEEAVERPDQLAITEPVVMELLMGARTEPHARALTEITGSLSMATVDTAHDFTAAATLFRAARAAGATPRRSVDCLIAAVAVRTQLPLAHKGADFAVLARVSQLGQVDLR